MNTEALEQMTVENGCTPAEAAVAASMLRKAKRKQPKPRQRRDLFKPDAKAEHRLLVTLSDPRITIDGDFYGKEKFLQFNCSLSGDFNSGGFGYGFAALGFIHGLMRVAGVQDMRDLEGASVVFVSSKYPTWFKDVERIESIDGKRVFDKAAFEDGKGDYPEVGRQ